MLFAFDAASASRVGPLFFISDNTLAALRDRPTQNVTPAIRRLADRLQARLAERPDWRVVRASRTQVQTAHGLGRKALRDAQES
jgi:hypothetical protein